MLGAAAWVVYFRRWLGLLVVVVQDSLAATLVDDGVRWLGGVDELEAGLADVLLDGGGSPEVSVMPLRA